MNLETRVAYFCIEFEIVLWRQQRGVIVQRSPGFYIFREISEC